VRRQVHTTYRGRRNRKFRKAINLRVSQFRRANGIAPWERLTLQQNLRAIYSDPFVPLKPKFKFTVVAQLIVKKPMEASA